MQRQLQVMCIAYGPGKNMLCTVFMLWMSGSSIQIFSLIMTEMAFFFAVNDVFNAFDRGEGIDCISARLGNSCQ